MHGETFTVGLSICFLRPKQLGGKNDLGIGEIFETPIRFSKAIQPSLKTERLISKREKYS